MFKLLQKKYKYMLGIYHKSMSILADRQYTICDFFSFNNLTVEDHLPHETIDIINKLATKVGAPTYNKTPNFKKKSSNRRRKDMDWSLLRNFKATEIKTAVLFDKLEKVTNSYGRETIEQFVIRALSSFQLRNGPFS